MIVFVVLFVLILGYLAPQLENPAYGAMTNYKDLRVRFPALDRPRPVEYLRRSV